MIPDIFMYTIIANISVIVGAILGYLFSRREKRKERLIDGIYRPLLGQISRAFEEIKNGKMPDMKEFEEIKQDGLYFVIDENVKEPTDQIYQELMGYKDLYDASMGRINQIVREEVEKKIETSAQGKDLEKYKSGDKKVNYRAFINHKYMGSINLSDCLLIGKTPVQILTERRTILKDSNIDSNISGRSAKRTLTDAIAKFALFQANKDTVIQDARLQQQSIIEDFNELIENLKKKVV
ncbi:hypothetical protein [[Eubacterium] cellulosolvens]